MKNALRTGAVAMGMPLQLAQIKDLPTLPEIVMRVRTLVGAEKTDARELANLIEQDPALSSRVLRVANSAYYTTPETRISSVWRAVARIGFDEVRDLAVAMNIVKLFGEHGSLDYRAFWRHSLTAAYLCRAIGAEVMGWADEPGGQRLFLAGLLHDVGLLVLDQYFHDDFVGVVDLVASRETPFLEAEKAVLGNKSHPGTGSALLELWKLEPSIIAAVRFHHAPNHAPQKFRTFVALLCVTEHALCTSRIGSLEGAMPDLPPDVREDIGLSESDRIALLSRAEAEVAGSDLILTMENQRGRRGLRGI